MAVGIQLHASEMKSEGLMAYMVNMHFLIILFLSSITLEGILYLYCVALAFF